MNSLLQNLRVVSGHTRLLAGASFLRPITTCAPLLQRSPQHYQQNLSSTARLDSTESGLVIRLPFNTKNVSMFSKDGVTLLWDRLMGLFKTYSAEKALTKRVGYNRAKFEEQCVDYYKRLNKAISEQDKHTMSELTTDRVYLSLRHMIRTRSAGEEHHYEFNKLDHVQLVGIRIFRVKSGQLTHDTVGTPEFAQATVYIQAQQTLKILKKGKFIKNEPAPETVGEYLIFERKLNASAGPGSTWRICGKLSLEDNHK